MVDASPIGQVFSASALAANPYAPIENTSDTTSSPDTSTAAPSLFSKLFSNSGIIFGQGAPLGPQNTPNVFNKLAGTGSSSGILGGVFSLDTWERIGLVVLGIMLIMMALFIFGISSIERVPVVGTAAKAAAKIS